MRKDQRNMEEVKPHPALAKLFGPQKLRKIRFLTTELPMLVPAVPWFSPSQGGFLIETARCRLCATGNDVMVLEMFSPTILAKKWRFLLQLLLFFQKLDHYIGF
jgi:DNA-directed RNA polymerase